MTACTCGHTLLPTVHASTPADSNPHELIYKQCPSLRERMATHHSGRTAHHAHRHLLNVAASLVY